MLLAIDAGNTNIVLGVCDPDDLDSTGRARWQAQWRIATQRARTEDEYVVLLWGLMGSAGLPMDGLSGVAISNVVPSIGRTLNTFAERVCSGPVLCVGPDTPASITVDYHTPGDVGPDRIVNAEAAYRFYGGPAVVVDYGTATTFDALTADGRYIGGAIAPGIGISVEALAQHAARLSRIELLPPEHAIGRSTVESMRSGIVLGFVEQTDGMVRRFAEELGGNPTVIATGGLAEMIASRSRTIRHVDPWLTLEGLRLVWQCSRSLNGK
ncbi:MAG: type III pantothenate kinase [Armatimonadetes bacterium]|nr:type III pantothenate kinase [Armatimonadota bacterium]